MAQIMASSTQDEVPTTANNADAEIWGNSQDVLNDEDEQRVLYQALDSFYQYAKVAHYNTTHLRRQSFYALPQSHWQLLAGPPFNYLDTLNAVDEAIDKNAELSAAILKSGLDSFGANLSAEGETNNLAWRGTANADDMDKARSTIRQFYRDWSAEGAVEREACYGPVIKDLLAEREMGGFEKNNMNVLVPGAGLGRLVFDLCHQGFNVEGNEISYHMLLASSYILNYCPGPKAHTIFPWCHTFVNHKTRDRQLQSVQVPDVHPGTTLQGNNPDIPLTRQPGEMSMSASDFICLYGDEDHKDVYDAVSTVFFIDTAPNFIRYIETIKNCLKSGGIWTNIGPLLWHFENNAPGSFGDDTKRPLNGKTTGIADPGSVELSGDEVIALIEHYGFKVEKKEDGLKAGYIQDTEAMLQNTYQATHWLARKL